ncbi:hypothetical protein [Micromonospora sp. NPDC047730]|uniref:hypothetical protein n=1 Tax=Micromonospora sp. NPDC047730 TaxID=3364253 RepID=UPI00371FB015
MDALTPAYEIEHPRGWRRLYRMPNGLGASVIPRQPAIPGYAAGTVDVLVVEWTGNDPDDHIEHLPKDWQVVEDFVRAVDSQGGDVYYGNGGCELQCVPEHELLGLLTLISRMP